MFFLSRIRKKNKQNFPSLLSPTSYPGQYPWGSQYPPPTLTTCDPTNPASNYQVERFSFLYTYLPRFEPFTYRSVILIHLHLTMQAIVAKPRIFLVIISYWSQTPLGQSLNLFISARLPSGAWTFSNSPGHYQKWIYGDVMRNGNMAA